MNDFHLRTIQHRQLLIDQQVKECQATPFYNILHSAILSGGMLALSTMAVFLVFA